MSNIFWTAYSNEDRYQAIHQLQKVIAAYGDIVDAKFFSDISLNIKIEMEERKVDALYSTLTQFVGIDKFENLNSHSKKERIIFLNISFKKGTGDLKTETPAVPG